MTAKQYLTNNIKLRIDDDSLGALERLAQAGDRSVAAEIRRAIRKHLAIEPHPQEADEPMEPTEASA